MNKKMPPESFDRHFFGHSSAQHHASSFKGDDDRAIAIILLNIDGHSGDKSHVSQAGRKAMAFPDTAQYNDASGGDGT